MNIVSRRMISVLLTVLMVLGFTVPVFAATENSTVPLWVTVFREYQSYSNKDAINKKTPTYGCTEIDDISYENDTDESHLLDVYSPGNVSATEALPVIVEVHGGAYTTCQKEINRQHGLYLASLGFRVVNINYTRVPEGTIVQEMQEIGDVYKWIFKKADQYGFDTDNMFITGDSSGGHLVLLFAAIQGSPKYQEMTGVDRIDGFRAVAATCPVGSFTANDLASTGMRILLGYGSDFNARNDADALSYEKFLMKSQPPTFLVTCSSDTTAYTTTKAIHKYMSEQGIPHKYKEYSNGTINTLEHVFNILDPDLDASIEANNDIATFFYAHIEK